MGNTTIGNVSITWLGHAGFMIKGDNRVIYVDPFTLPESMPDEDMADILLITHEHSEHCCPDSIRKIRKSDSTTLIPENMSLQFRGDARRIMQGDELIDELSIKGVDIRVVSAYNKISSAHLDGQGVGYIFKVAGLNIYHSGDTDFLPLDDIDGTSVDIALLPIGGVSVMDEKAAADAAVLLSPSVVIPMHYTGKNGNPEEFKKLVNDANPEIDVVIL